MTPFFAGAGEEKGQSRTTKHRALGYIPIWLQPSSQNFVMRAISSIAQLFGVLVVLACVVGPFIYG